MADKWRVKVYYTYRRQGVHLGMYVDAETREIAELRGEAIVKQKFPAAKILAISTKPPAKDPTP